MVKRNATSMCMKAHTFIFLFSSFFFNSIKKAVDILITVGDCPFSFGHSGLDFSPLPGRIQCNFLP